MKFDFCYLITNSFSSRMILQSEIIPNLQKEGKTVCIIVPNSEEPNLVTLAENLKVQVFPLKEKKGWIFNEYSILKKYIYEDIKKNPALWEKHLRSVKMNKSKHPRRILRPYFFILLHYIVYKGKIGKSIFKKFENRLFKNEAIFEQLKDIDPATLICTYPSDLRESAYLKNANQQNINTVIQLLSWDNIVTKGHFSELSNHFIAWGSIMAKEAKEFYKYSDDKLHHAGVAHFDKHINEVSKERIDKYFKQLGADPTKKTLIFGMSSPYFTPYEIEIVEWIAKTINKGELGDIQFIVRPHPQNVQGYMADTSWLPRLDKLKSDHVFLNLPLLHKSSLDWNMKSEDLITLVNLVAGSSIVLNSCSTFSIDGLVQDKPVILTAFDSDKKLNWIESVTKTLEYPHIKKLIATNGLEVTHDYDELKQTIINLLEKPDKNKELREKAKIAECGICDGQASFRIAQTLLKILN